MDLVLNMLLFVGGLTFLVKFADYFTDAAYSIGKHMKFSDFIIGVVIVSIGTSLPELATTIISSLRGEHGIILGNLLGSNISNVLLILGIAAFFASSKIKKNLKDVDLPISLLTIFLLVVLSIDGVVGRLDGVLLLIAFITYIIYAKNAKRESGEEHEIMPMWKAIPLLLISIAVVYISSNVIIESIINISSIIGTASTIISATALAVGTSLPELSVSIQAARKHLFDVVIGNIIGSNIFNISFILGVGALISPLIYDALSLYILLPGVVLATFVILEVLETNTIKPYEGTIMLLLFAAYVLLLIHPPMWVR